MTLLRELEIYRIEIRIKKIVDINGYLRLISINFIFNKRRVRHRSHTLSIMVMTIYKEVLFMYQMFCFFIFFLDTFEVLN